MTPRLCLMPADESPTRGHFERRSSALCRVFAGVPGRPGCLPVTNQAQTGADAASVFSHGCGEFFTEMKSLLPLAFLGRQNVRFNLTRRPLGRSSCRQTFVFLAVNQRSRLMSLCRVDIFCSLPQCFTHSLRKFTFNSC